MDGYLRFHCPKCNKRLKCLPAHAGRMTSCSDCGHRVRIPADPERQTEAPSATGGVAVALPLPAQRSARPPRRIQFDCPDCGGKLAVRASAVFKQITCPRCGETVVVPAPQLEDSDDGSKPRPRRFPLGWVGVGVVLLAVLLAGVTLEDRVPTDFATAIEIAAVVLGLAGLAMSLVGVLTRRGWVGGCIGVACGLLFVSAALLVGVMRGGNRPTVEQWYTTAEPLRGPSPGDSYRLNQPADRKLVFVVVKVRIAGRDLYRKNDNGDGFDYQFKTDDVHLVAANGETFPAGLSDSGGGFAFTLNFTDNPADGSHDFAFAVDERLVRDGALWLQVRGTRGPELARNLQTSAPSR